jgi:hypothetical protein
MTLLAALGQFENFMKMTVIRRFTERRGRAREAISLAPRLQPGDSKPALTRNRF